MAPADGALVLWTDAVSISAADAGRVPRADDGDDDRGRSTVVAVRHDLGERWRMARLVQLRLRARHGRPLDPLCARDAGAAGRADPDRVPLRAGRVPIRVRERGDRAALTSGSSATPIA